MAEDAPPFQLGGSRFDNKTFLGRLRGIVVQFDPLKLFASSAKIQGAKKLLEDYGGCDQTKSTISNKTLWEAQELLRARVHPDTGEEIFMPLCFAAYTPMQPIIVLGMLWPGAGAVNQAFWQWYNQSYNAAVFYANKNKSSELTNMQVAQSYCLSVTSALVLSLGAQKAGKLIGRRNPALGGVVGNLAAFAGCVGAGWCSLMFMRNDEFLQGVHVKDDEGNVYGLSKVAGTEGLVQCATARVVWNIPATGVMPLLLHKFANPIPDVRARILAQTILITCGVVAGIYPGQALYEQEAQIDAQDLEPEFQNLRKPNGDEIKTFYFNKGL